MANNETEEREIRESIPFTITPKTIRYLGINLTRDVKDLYARNYRSLLKDIEEDIKNGKIFHAHGLEELISLKCLCFPEQSRLSMPSRSKYQ